MAVKYQILFKDKRGNDCSVKFDFADYTGTDVISLTGAGTPVTITYDGDQDDIFTPIITSKANVQVLVNQITQQFVDDIRDIDDKQCFVTILYGKNKKWIGNLIADQNYEKFDETGYFMSLTCVDPFSYLKENIQQILSASEMYGFQTIYDFIQAVINESAPGIPIEIINNYAPSIKNIYFYTDTLMTNGVYPDGYTMISKLMTSLCMTAIISNGVLYLINHRSRIRETPKEIGIQPLGATDYLLANSEIITRTRGVKQLSVDYQYPDLANYIQNGAFYFYDTTQTEGQEITGWTYNPALLTDGGTITRVGNGTDNFPYGVRFTGKFNASDISGQIPYNTATVSATYILNTSNFENLSLYFGISLDIDFTYMVYEMPGTDKMQYYFRIYASVDGDSTVYNYNQDIGGGDYQWMPVSTHPGHAHIDINSTASRQKNTVDIVCLFGDTDYGYLPVSWEGEDVKITVELYGLVPVMQTNYLSDNPVNPIVYDITVNSVKIYLRNIVKIGDNEGGKDDTFYIYSSDSTTITNKREYSLVADAVSVYADRKSVVQNTLLPNIYLLRNDSGTFLNADKTPITNYSFGNDFTVDKMITLIAKDRMFFGRQPRYKVDCEFESDNVDMSDTIKFTQGDDLLLPNTYTILSDELDVRMCRHHVTVQELNGSDDDTDTIQNYLGTD